MNVLGLKITSHDTGAALIAGGKIVAIAEERLNRVKHSPNIFPALSIDYCLREFDLAPDDIDLIVIDQVDLRSKVDMEGIFRAKSRHAFPQVRIEVINHHDAHAASAFFASPFEDAAVLVYDGAGEKFATHLGVCATETETLYRGRGTDLIPIQKTLHLRDGKTFPYTFGVGKLYTFLSETYLGLGRYNEGKMMGLAAYGDHSVLDTIPRERWCAEVGGHVICNSRIVPALRPLSTVQKKISVGPKWVWWKARLAWGKFARFIIRKTNSEIFSEPRVFSPIHLEKPVRPPGDPLPDAYYSAIAYTGQHVLEWVARQWGRRLRDITRAENLCVAGGVGLNIDANKKFLDDVGFKRLFVQPAASDTGIALGCALWGWHVTLRQPRFFTMRSASLGHRYSDVDIEHALRAYEGKVAVERLGSARATRIAGLVAEGNIVAWFSGGSEYGPRALGNRSIVCDPRLPDMKDILNIRVKHREQWRPFAASVLLEYMPEWFDINVESPFMLLAAQVREEKRKEVPSIVHIDGTCRLQSLTKEENGGYFDLVSAFNDLTGVPLILNTSFNLGGDPIVETPRDALDSFMRTDIDYLVLEGFLVRKKLT